MRLFQKIVIDTIQLTRRCRQTGFFSHEECITIFVGLDRLVKRLNKHYKRERLSVQRKQLKNMEN
jgi:hypothetical protein